MKPYHYGGLGRTVSVNSIDHHEKSGDGHEESSRGFSHRFLPPHVQSVSGKVESSSLHALSGNFHLVARQQQILLPFIMQPILDGYSS